MQNSLELKNLTQNKLKVRSKEAEASFWWIIRRKFA